MLSTRVILLRATNLSDARYAAGMGVEFIGFSINPASNHYVTSDDVNTIGDWLSGVSLIGDIGNSIPEYGDYKVDYLLTENPDHVNALDEPIISLRLTKDNVDEIELVLAKYTDSASFFILSLAAEEIDVLSSKLIDIFSRYKCYIATDFNKSNLESILNTNPSGIVLFGSHEEKPGLSNYDGIADILELLDE